jgi:hypothetical protein
LMRELNCNMKISLSEPSTPLGGRNIHGNSPVAIILYILIYIYRYIYIYYKDIIYIIKISDI